MLKVYFVGLVYFDGCNADERHAYAPDGRAWSPPHYAGLWIDAALVDVANTTWPGTPHPMKVRGQDVTIVEFRVPSPARIWFPDQEDEMSCEELDTRLPKLKKKINDTEKDFNFNPATAETIAEVTMRGGAISPRKFEGQLGVVEWTITNYPTLEITAVSKPGDADLGKIRLIIPAATAAEVVFCNIHDVMENENKDMHAGNHVGVFRKLNPAIGSDTIVISNPPGNPAQPLQTKNAFLQFLRHIAHTEGETPPCCHGGGI